MQKRRLLFALLLGCVYATSFVCADTFLCRLIKEQIANFPKAETLQEIISTAVKARYPEVEKGSYRTVLVRRENSTEFLFGHRGSTKDSEVIIRFPESGESTVYSLLSKDQRFELVLALRALFKSATYDFDFTFIGKPSPLREALDEFTKDLVGTSPEKLLARACSNGKVGCCRNVNTALFGLLIELGWPIDQILMVRGKASLLDDYAHLWLEIKLSYDDEWRELDATPFVAPDDPGLVEKEKRLPRNPRPVNPKTIREAYPFDRREFKIHGMVS